MLHLLLLFVLALLPSGAQAHGRVGGHVGHVHVVHHVRSFPFGVGSYYATRGVAFCDAPVSVGAPLTGNYAEGSGTCASGQLTSYQGVSGYYTTDAVGRRYFVSGVHVIAVGHGHRFAGPLPRGVRFHGHIPRRGAVARLR